MTAFLLDRGLDWIDLIEGLPQGAKFHHHEIENHLSTLGLSSGNIFARSQESQV